MATPQKHALTVIAQSQISTAVEISSLKEAAIQQLVRVSQMESEAAYRAIFAGIALHRIKASLQYGEFGTWLKTQEGIAKKSQVNNYMRLATVLVEKVRATKADLLSLGGNGEIIPASESGQTFAKKVASFVGECSLNELLVKYGIKGVAREGDTTEENAPGAPGDEGQLFFAEIAQHLYGFRQSVLKPESIMRMPPDKLRAVLDEHNSQNAELKALCAKAGVE